MLLFRVSSTRFNASAFLLTVIFLNIVSVAHATRFPATLSTTTTACNPNCTRLQSIKSWRREAGYWVGDYTLIGADGAPFASPGWPYGYASYQGFIRLKLDGACLTQRNVFVYPPLSAAECRARRAAGGTTAVGGGTCGKHGNELLFRAFQTASDCQGSLAGPFFAFSTATRVLDDERVLYTVRDGSGTVVQSQQTVLGDGWRVRSALGLLPNGTARSISFYRERRVSRTAFFAALRNARHAYNVRPADYCAWQFGNVPSGVTCRQHFKIDKCDRGTGSGKCRAQRLRFRRWTQEAQRCSWRL